MGKGCLALALFATGFIVPSVLCGEDVSEIVPEFGKWFHSMDKVEDTEFVTEPSPVPSPAVAEVASVNDEDLGAWMNYQKAKDAAEAKGSSDALVASTTSCTNLRRKAALSCGETYCAAQQKCETPCATGTRWAPCK